MKKKFLIRAALITAMSLLSVSSVYAGEWKNDEKGWWWQEYDGTYIYAKQNSYGDPEIASYLIDADKDGTAELYSFDTNGYLYTNIQLDFGNSYFEDIHMINSDGARLDKNGNVEAWTLAEGEIKTDTVKGFFKDKFVGLLGKDLQTVDTTLNTTKEHRSYTENGVLHLYDPSDINNPGISLKNDKVDTISGIARDLFENPNISADEISEILGIQPQKFVSSVQGSVIEYDWTIQENPKVTLVVVGEELSEYRNVYLWVDNYVIHN